MKLKKISRGLGRGAYFAEGFALYFLPAFLTRLRYHHADSRFSDKEMEEIMTRADYYVRLPEGSRVDSPDARITGDFRFPFHAEKKHTAYFFDIYPFLRMQKKDLRFYYIDEDIDTEAPQPTFVKSRPVTASPTNSVLCRLNSLRHFRFVKDTVPFREKDDIIVSRNVVVQPWRIALLEKYFGHPATDFGQTNLTGGRPEWIKPFMPVEEQLRHKFIMCVRGVSVN